MKLKKMIFEIIKKKIEHNKSNKNPNLKKKKISLITSIS